MLLDRAFWVTLKNFSTLFLVVAVITVPLHLAYSFFYRDVLALIEIHTAIEQLPPSQPVATVTPEALERARLAYLGLCGIELLFIPLLWRATSRVVALDRAGRLPTVVGAWRLKKINSEPVAPAGSRILTLLVGVTFSLVVWWLAERSGTLILEVIPDSFLFLGLALVRSMSVALGAPFGLVAAVLACRPREVNEG